MTNGVLNSYKILIVDYGTIDCKVMKTILSEKLGSEADIHTVQVMEEAVQKLQQRDCDLLIVNVPFHKSAAKEFVKRANHIQSGIHTILISSKAEKEIAQLANRLHVNQYILKPFTREKLLETVEYELNAIRTGESQTGEEPRTEYVGKIVAFIQNCQYKECVDTAKEYLESLYESIQSTSALREAVIAFSTEIENLGNMRSEETKARLRDQNARIKGRFDFPNNRFMVVSLVGDMLSLIFEDMDSGEMNQDDIMKKALNYIDRNITKKISLETVAEYINLSPTYFSKFFKKKTGMNFITYVTDCKIEYAKEMLKNTDVPVANIAHELAYNETNYFCKAFKKKNGVTPTEYRETHLGA
ncbi:MAG: response regulator transcription factor [Hespellia sp.]|nr:response regulator transcription factor [Hespellia sp.]